MYLNTKSRPINSRVLSCLFFFLGGGEGMGEETKTILIYGNHFTIKGRQKTTFWQNGICRLRQKILYCNCMHKYSNFHLWPQNPSLPCHHKDLASTGNHFQTAHIWLRTMKKLSSTVSVFNIKVQYMYSSPHQQDQQPFCEAQFEAYLHLPLKYLQHCT